jgi:hypothetical protein
MTDCPVCAKRQADERKQLADCEQRCKHGEAKSQRLSIVLAVVSTLVAKETLDQAVGIADRIGQAGGPLSGQIRREPDRDSLAANPAAAQDRLGRDRDSNAGSPGRDPAAAQDRPDLLAANTGRGQKPQPLTAWPAAQQIASSEDREPLFPALPPLLTGLGFDPWKPMLELPEPAASLIPEPTGLALLYLGLKPSRRRQQ